VGFVLVAVSWKFLPETLAASARQSFHPMALLNGYREVGVNVRFLLLSLAAGFNFNAFFLYIVSAPVFLGTHLGLGPRQYAWLFIPSIAGIMMGAQLSGRAAGRLTPRNTVKFAYAFMATAACANLAYALFARPSLPWAVLPIMVYGIGFAMAMPSITLTTLDLFPTRRGMAASLQGFVSGMVNTLTAGLVSPALSPDPRWLALGMTAMMGLGLGSWMLYLRSSARRRVVAPHPGAGS
jgi:DHA1 family bicyclomycin/chloramphenicol resistance-like MFS transporter